MWENILCLWSELQQTQDSQLKVMQHGFASMIHKQNSSQQFWLNAQKSQTTPTKCQEHSDLVSNYDEFGYYNFFF